MNMTIPAFEHVNKQNAISALFRELYLNFSESDLTSLIGVPQYICEMARKGERLEDYYVEKIKSSCGFSSTNLQIRGIDHSSVIEKLKGRNLLPFRYSTSAYSSRRTSDSILYRLPETIVEDALNFLQIDGSFYDEQQINQKVSTLLNSDLILYLATKFHLTDKAIYGLGQASGKYHEQKAFGHSFKSLTPRESFSKVIEEIVKHFETSFSYQLAFLDNNKAVIQRFLSEKILDEQKITTYSNQSYCKFIQGSFSAITYYTTGKFAYTTEEKCVFRGDHCCEFHVNLNDLRQLS